MSYRKIDDFKRKAFTYLGLENKPRLTQHELDLVQAKIKKMKLSKKKERRRQTRQLIKTIGYTT